VSPAIEFQFRWFLRGVGGGEVGFGLCKINCIDRLGREVCVQGRNDALSLKSGRGTEKKMAEKGE
jgi:hypothetical protein